MLWFELLHSLCRLYLQQQCTHLFTNVVVVLFAFHMPAQSTLPMLCAGGVLNMHGRGR